jgi:hypothetical protein
VRDLETTIRRSRPDATPNRRRLEEIRTAALDALPSAATIARGRVRRRLILAVEVAAAIAVVAVLVVLVIAVPSDEPASPPTPSLPSGWREHRDPASGVDVWVPPGWGVAPTRLASALADPHEILSMGTGPLAAGGPCGNEATRAIRGAAPAGAFVSVQERSIASSAGGFREVSPALTPRDYPSRPRHFDLRKAASAQPMFGCVGSAKVDVWWIPFREGERAFYLLVALGDKAPATLRAATKRVVDSLAFADGRTVGMGPWMRLADPRWSGASRTYRDRSVLQVATVPLPARITNDLDGQQDRLGPGDLQISVIEFISRPHPADPPAGRLPVQLTREDFKGPRYEFQSTTALAVRYFRYGPDTVMRVHVALGPADTPGQAVSSEQRLPEDADRLIEEANDVLSTLVPAGRAARR